MKKPALHLVIIIFSTLARTRVAFDAAIDDGVATLDFGQEVCNVSQRHDIEEFHP
jgi:hypothetical protein